MHVWRIALDGAWPEAAAVLHAAELERAQRFAFERDRLRYVRGRHAMRSLLGAYLGIAPAQIEIHAGAHGKPFVAPSLGLAFNLSHAADDAVLAVSRSPDVGVDIEALSPRLDLPALAATVFTEEERGQLASFPEAARLAAFLTGWTRKEACLKALGVGLTVEPRGVHVGLEPARRQVRLTAAQATRSVDVERIIADDRAVAALAVADGYTRYRMLHWTA